MTPRFIITRNEDKKHLSELEKARKKVTNTENEILKKIQQEADRKQIYLSEPHRYMILMAIRLASIHYLRQSKKIIKDLFKTTNNILKHDKK